MKYLIGDVGAPVEVVHHKIGTNDSELGSHVDRAVYVFVAEASPDEII
jgi:hypothetical protein